MTDSLPKFKRSLIEYNVSNGSFSLFPFPLTYSPSVPTVVAPSTSHLTTSCLVSLIPPIISIPNAPVGISPSASYTTPPISHSFPTDPSNLSLTTPLIPPSTSSSLVSSINPTSIRSTFSSVMSCIPSSIPPSVFPPPIPFTLFPTVPSTPFLPTASIFLSFAPHISRLIIKSLAPLNSLSIPLSSLNILTHITLATSSDDVLLFSVLPTQAGCPLLPNVVYIVTGEVSAYCC
mmetsp:Transcript_25111/g.41595  ORF Transcript_25111/g.41595 Transcript_25111/m.41595 type:complete len:233 (+) Transcript_25111:154-852(+)